MFNRKSMLTTMLCTVAVGGATAGAAFAGEITGNGKPTAGPTHANSICVFSGQNDHPKLSHPVPRARISDPDPSIALA